MDREPTAPVPQPNYFFPGMDPFIQNSGLWEDFHHHFIEQIAMSLAGRVPERYLVRSGVRSYIIFVESKETVRRAFIPDVSIRTSRGGRSAGKKGGAALAEAPGKAQPITMRSCIEEEHREAYVEIYDLDPPRSSAAEGKKKQRRLVTNIEVLSPANKQPKARGWKVYQRKRQACLVGEVNLVEIDLVRGGRRMPMTDPWPESIYALLVARAKDSPVCMVWPFNLDQPVPAIPVPLAAPDADVQLSLQPLIEQIYERFRYAQSIDYGTSLVPPLRPEEAAWIEQKLQKRPGRAKSAT